MKAPRLTEHQIIAIVQQAAAGVSTSALCKEHGISSATLQRWCTQYSDTVARRKTRTAADLSGMLYKPGRQVVPIEDMQVTEPDALEHPQNSGEAGSEPNGQTPKQSK